MIKKHFKWIFLLLFIGLCLFVGKSFQAISPREIQYFLLQYGKFAPIIYIILFTIVPLTLFPDAVLAIASGIVFGPFWGSIYTMIGALCGGTLAYSIAYFFGKNTLTHKLEQYATVQTAIKNKGFSMVFTLRLIPLIPFDIISYASGASGVSYRGFISATALGIIPGVIALVNIGAGMNEINSPRLYIAIAVFVLLIVVAKNFKGKLLAE